MDNRFTFGALCGGVGTPKTPESLAPLPLLEQVSPAATLMEEVRQAEDGLGLSVSERRSVNLHNLVARVIRPRVEVLRIRSRGVRPEVYPLRGGSKWGWQLELDLCLASWGGNCNR